MRHFGVININDKNAQTFIDGIRLLCSDNSKVKHRAHVTLIGPKDNADDIDFKSIRRNEQIVYVTGVGNFFSEGQNTVYLKCDLEQGGAEIKSMINKPDFGNENPHITLYDGENRVFAEKLYQLTQSEQYKNNIKFQIIVSENNYNVKKEYDLGVISTTKEYLPFNSTIDCNHLSYYLGGETINEDVVKELTEFQRLEFIEKLFSLFTNWQNNKVIANPSIYLINELNLIEENGLFFYDDLKKWSIFPTNIKQGIHQAKPYAFFTLQDVNTTKRFDTNLPFVFIYSNPTEEEEEIIRQKVFNFGHAPIVILHRKIVKIINGLIYNRNIQEDDNLLIKYQLSDFTYEKLLTKDFWDEHLVKKRSKNIYNCFLSDINGVRNYLIKTSNLTPIICNRLIGRLLFVRYLIDRQISFKKEDGSYFFNKNSEIFAEAIKDKTSLYSFFKYLKEKYNGDLFPVDEDEINTITNNHLKILSILFKGGKFNLQNENLYIQDSLFDVYDFSIIPIELVSNVYESFMGEKQKPNSIKIKNKAFYTPFFLADFVLENTLNKHIKKEQNLNFTCPVLDPSCGSGIFLVEALRKIIERKIEIKNEALSREELWNCVLKNIFGIDIDKEAIDIAVFSIYVTVLDYISPAEISENFKFETLKETNLFVADFFDTRHHFNKVLSSKIDSDEIDFKTNKYDKVDLRFIIGNPPWGQIKNVNSKEDPKYISYCNYREKAEKKVKKRDIKIGISDKQIAQAFLIRVNDFSNKITEYAFVVTSKILYNTNAKLWRKYFFDNFSVNEIYDFSPVRSYLFKDTDAGWPTIVLFYSDKNDKKFEYLSVNSKEFSKRFDSFSVSQQSLKEFTQNEIQYFSQNYDWFWKTMLYGSFFDFLIIKRLKEQYLTIFDYVRRFGFEHGVGLKRIDGDKKPNATKLIGCKFIDTQKKELQQFLYNSSNTWQATTAGNIPHKDLFTPPLALIKEGLTPEFKGVAAFCDEKVIFTHSVRAIKGQKKDSDILKFIVGLINSDLFSYYILHTGSSAGVDLTRANQIEQFSLPIPNPNLSKEISTLVDSISNLSIYDNLLTYNKNRTNLIKELNKKVLDLYSLSIIDKDFIDYTVKHITKTLKSTKVKKVKQEKELEGYKNVFLSYFNNHNLSYNVSCFLDREKKFIGIFFEQSKTLFAIRNPNLQSILQLYQNLSVERISKQIFLQKTIIEQSVDRKSFCIIKANNIENWQCANAWLDLVRFIKEMISPNKELYNIYEDLYNEQIKSKR